MGVKNPKEWIEFLATLGVKPVDPEIMPEMLHRVENWYEDVEGTLYSFMLTAKEPNDVRSHCQSWFRVTREHAPNVRNVCGIFDYGPNKPERVKMVLREKSLETPYSEDLVPGLRLDSTNFFQTVMRNGLEDVFKRWMATPELRQHAREFFARGVVEATQDIEGVNILISGVRTADNNWIDFLNGVEQPTDPDRAGEGELEVVNLISRHPGTTFVVSEDSDSIAILLLALYRLGAAAPQVYLNMNRGMFARVFDMNAMLRAVVEWGEKNGVNHAPATLGMMMAMGGSDYVQPISGIGYKRLKRMFDVFGLQSIKTCINSQPSLDGWIDRSGIDLFLRYAMAVDVPTSRDKKLNTRKRRFADLEEGGKILIPTFEESFKEAGERKSAAAGVIVPSEVWLDVYVRQVMWQVVYWQYGHTREYPDPLGRTEDGAWLWGWMEKDNGIVTRRE